MKTAYKHQCVKKRVKIGNTDSGIKTRSGLIAREEGFLN